MKPTEISVVIPVYQGESCLEELCRRLAEALSRITSDYEILLVEDCGPDGSWEKIQCLAKRDRRIRGFRFSRNFGQHTGITAGMDHARGRWIVVMDCDLQDRPEEIPRLYAKAKEGFDVVLARRTHRQDGFLKRQSGRLFFACFNRLAGTRMDPAVGNFRIISRKVADVFCGMRETTRFFAGMVDWMGFPSASVDVEHDKRFSGETSYTFAKMVKMALPFIIAYSDRPLWMTVRLGFFISTLSLGYGLWIIYRYFHHSIPVMGWSSLIVSLYFIGGVIISLLGVIGIYVGRIFDETKGRPLYVLAHRTEEGQMDEL